jgi:hypothetical protein
LSRHSRQFDISLKKVRSALTNGSTLIAGEDADGRMPWMRRLRDIVRAHIADLGGEANISHSERALLNRASMLVLQLEMMEASFAKNGGMASPDQLNQYQRLVNTLRRTMETLGLQRRARDVTNGITLGDMLRADQEQERQRLAEADDAEIVAQEAAE